MVGMVALEGCNLCKDTLDCRDAVEVVADASVLEGENNVKVSRDAIYCSRCYEGKILPMVESGHLRKMVALDLSRPLWAPPPDPTTLPLPGVLSEEQPAGSVRVVIQVTDGRKVMGPAEEEDELFPVPGDKEYVTWDGERYPVPSMGEVESWIYGGTCEALDGCTVEPDGKCEHGAPSWLIQLGMI
tara:strand:+ start:221 stop:778 length:558 start_codon:yes stop_codon:yes gene_type:complete